MLHTVCMTCVWHDSLYNESTHIHCRMKVCCTHKCMLYTEYMLYTVCMTCVWHDGLYNESTYIRYMGWLRLVGSLKSWVSFAKEPYKRDDILQKIPIIFRSLLTVATPYNECMLHAWMYDFVTFMSYRISATISRLFKIIGLFCERAL